MIIAVPLTETNEFSSHFGGSAKAGLFEVDTQSKTIVRSEAILPPAPEPCGWADWLVQKGVKLVLAGGMGRGAQQRMADAGISVLVGVPPVDPQALVQAWLDGRLQSGANACERGHQHHGEHDDHQHHGECGDHHANGCSCSN